MMPAGVVLAIYGAAFVVPLVLLHYFRATHWYWHALSVVAALVIGLSPLPAAWHTPSIEIAIGGLFVLLFVGGVAAPFFPRRHDTRHARPYHA